MDYSRIESSVDVKLLRKTKIVVVGAGGSYSFVISMARMGIGEIIVLDFDTVEASNIVRQGYAQADIGKYKVEALGEAVKRINPETKYCGITKNFHNMNEAELDDIFQDADLLLFLTDSWKAQSFANILALKYNKAAIWAGWYAQSRTAELFFQIPHFTPACFRCCASSRYIANEKEEIKVSSNSNTIFHSQILDSLIGFVAMAIIHRNQKISQKELAHFFKGMMNNEKVDYNFFQFKVHPDGGNSLFDKAFDELGMNAHNFVSYWQKVDAEIPENGYDYVCPDCQGKLHELVKPK